MAPKKPGLEQKVKRRPGFHTLLSRAENTLWSADIATTENTGIHEFPVMNIKTAQSKTEQPFKPFILNWLTFDCHGLSRQRNAESFQKTVQFSPYVQ
ncbi:hypothetical protein [Oxalobacter paraformigenes]|uniref:hypothetical protein n=1 Tax=Oxalobacter paraformigenes TaxID=556268 RepID=UPI0001A2986D|nr:hypothetical protein [Oxalobacter paraformigenes]